MEIRDEVFAITPVEEYISRKNKSLKEGNHVKKKKNPLFEQIKKNNSYSILDKIKSKSSKDQNMSIIERLKAQK